MKMMKRIVNRSLSSLSSMLTCLTLLFIGAQLSFFLIRYYVSDLIDSLVNASIVMQLLHPAILVPLIIFILIQCAAYILFIMWIWFISNSTSKLFKLSEPATYRLGVVIWIAACISMLLLNKYFFPDSFFSKWIWPEYSFNIVNKIILFLCLTILFFATVFSYIQFFLSKQFHFVGSVLLLTILSLIIFSVQNEKIILNSKNFINSNLSQPNIIFIGLDSLRPDFTSYYGNKNLHTPNIDAFLKSSVNFTQAYTPLARTYPSWISILTGKYPKNNNARNNLIDPNPVMMNDTLAKHLQSHGYETIYATDEKRFSNVDQAYGFDKILGPKMGVNDFLLGSLSDFPLTNLLINLPTGRFLFPYNYGNRAAAITYYPNTFLQLIKFGLADRSSKPLFLSVHLCLSHWPFTWARDQLKPNSLMANQYANSVQAVDKQLGQLMQILKENGLLKNSLVVLLSDHGTGLGLLGDRIISENNYQGDKKDLALISKLKLSSSSYELSVNKNDYTINTAYGQGTNVLGLTQYRVLLAFKRYDENFLPHSVDELTSLIDIAPTILDFLQFESLQKIDGISLKDFLWNANKKFMSRFFYLETGDSISEIETDHIYIEKVLKHEIGIYRIDPATGLLRMTKKAEFGVIKNKQLAVIKDEWLLAYHPADLQKKLVRSNPKLKSSKLISKTYKVPAYFVLANLKTQKWSIGLKSKFTENTPAPELFSQLKNFYGDELP